MSALAYWATTGCCLACAKVPLDRWRKMSKILSTTTLVFGALYLLFAGVAKSVWCYYVAGALQVVCGAGALAAAFARQPPLALAAAVGALVSCVAIAVETIVWLALVDGTIAPRRCEERKLNAEQCGNERTLCTASGAVLFVLNAAVNVPWVLVAVMFWRCLVYSVRYEGRIKEATKGITESA
eukprot:m51a1_g7103 hypothetical protein (183) ;mRNA; f:56466-57475